MAGYVHSFQSLGAADGPGVRFVVFLCGCPLRCAYCHNPDTWEKSEGTLYCAEDIIKNALRYRSYFGKTGGITVSGGEPLMQAEFVREIFALAKQNGLTTALDTSGCLYNDVIDGLLDVTDTVLLDYKMANGEDYKRYTLCDKEKVDNFLEVLEKKKISTWIRRVIVTSVNDDKKSMEQLFALKNKYSCIQKIELLPFKKYCKEKYEERNIPFPFDIYPETSKETIEKLYKLGEKI